MQKKFTLTLFLFAIFFSSSLIAQMTVTGTVTDDGGETLIGANVLIKNTSNGTITDIDGKFSILANTGDVLEVSYIGYTSKEMIIGTDPVVNITLGLGEQLSEVIVVAYGTQKKVTVVGAVSQLKGSEMIKSPAVNLTSSLAGRLSGLTVIQPSGEPGADDARITIRGTNTLGNSSPLIVIDGIPDRDGGFGRLSPQDIESVSVLKDASAAIYGARAANGAILITTKRGKTGKPTISYSFNQGWSQPTITPRMSNAVEYANIMNELPIYKSIPQSEWGAASASIKSTGVYDSPTADVGSLSANFSPEAVARHGAGDDPWAYPDTDWFGDAFKTWAPQQNHALSMSGGSENLRYYASLGFTDQDAIYRESATFYKQYSFRTNLDAKINDYIDVNLGVAVRREDRNYPTQSAGAIFRMLMRGRPTEPEVWPTGEPGPDIENGQNPYVITTNATGYVENPKDLTQINMGIDIANPWIDGLVLNLSGAIDKNTQSTKIWQTPWELYYLDRETYLSSGDINLNPAIRSPFQKPSLRQASSSVLNNNLTAMLRYDTKIGAEGELSALAGVTRERFTGSNFNAFRRDFISPAVDQLFAGASVGQQTGGGAYNRARLGYYGRVNYNFKETYLAEFIWRYDGSYIFPETERFGFFPGILLGYNITNEPWFNVNGLDFLKIRFSYGQMGNDQVFFNGQLQEFAFLSTYGFGQYPIDGVVQSTLEERLLANPSFTWERANNLNVGIDGNLFGALDFTIEYFKNRRDQILIQKTGSTPSSSGISNLLPPVNAGEVENSGVEFSFIYNSKGNSDLRWNAGINGGYAKNRVIFQDEVPGAPEYQLQEGKPIGAYLVYESDGVFLDQASIESNTLDYSAVTGTLIPGDMKFKDINGDGIIDADDQTRLEKNTVPTFTFGGTFNLFYKNFDFSLLLQGSTGAAIRIQTESGDIGNFLKYSHDNRWSIDNPSSVHPRLASRGDTYYTGGPYGNNTYFLFNKDYVRLKNLEIGYTLNPTLIRKTGLGSLRVYANGLNLITLNEFKIFDPEAEAGSGVYYPLNRVLNTGITISF